MKKKFDLEIILYILGIANCIISIIGTGRLLYTDPYLSILIGVPVVINSTVIMILMFGVDFPYEIMKNRELSQNKEKSKKG